MGLEKGQLLWRFNAFGDDVKLEAFAHGDDRADKRTFFILAINIFNKRLVDL